MGGDHWHPPTLEVRPQWAENIRAQTAHAQSLIPFDLEEW